MLALLSEPIVTAISAHLGCDATPLRRLIGPPTRADAGDLALPCFQLAKAAKRNPAQLASDLMPVVEAALPGISVVAVGPFLNITFPPGLVAERLLGVLCNDPVAPLRCPDQQRTVCVDFSSPNIAKHLAFHHIRSTGIGNALAQCYEAAGWRVVRINFLGDWGTAFGRLMAGWQREGLSRADLEAAADPVAFFNDIYVRISRAGKDDPSVAEEAREWSRRCEADDPEALELWQIIRDASLAAAKEIYALLNIDFDDWRGEAHYRKHGAAVVGELESAGLLREDQGAKVVDLEEFGFKKPCLILRSDGGSLYATRDLAACEDRHQRYGFDRALYVVDLGQSLHFKEWFAVAARLGKPYAGELRHVGFGVIQMWNEEEQRWAKTATRNGVPMMLMDVLREAIDRARAVVDEKNPDLPEAEKAAVAEAVGLGAVLFNDLRNNRKGDIRFRFEDALNMQGDTGPYLQYAHARLCSIERRFAEAFGDRAAPDPALLDRDEEKAVLLAIARLQRALSDVVAHDDPSQLANALLALAAATSSWLTLGNRDRSARVLCEQRERAMARVALVAAVRAALGEGLRLLGIRAPERM